MTPRLDYRQAAPDAFHAHAALEAQVRRSGLDPALLALVKLRASHLNGCAFCVDMHAKDARLAGETEQRVYAVPVWRETLFFTARERAALAWTDAVTRLGAEGVPDDAFDLARAHFEEAELVWLTLAVVAINGWNRLAIAFRTPPGSYVPGTALAAAG